VEQSIDRREFVKRTAAAGAGFSLAGLAGCETGAARSDAGLRSVEEVDAAAVERFIASLTGPAIRPAGQGYDAARQVWNGKFDRRPGLIVRCADSTDVARAVDFARSETLLVAVRGGGHGGAGHGSCDGGMVIDLSRMKGLEVDPGQGIARAEPGVRSLEMDAATQQHGLATVMPVCPGVGIGGFTLGGGYGLLAGKYGFSCDNLVSAEVVLADGTTVVVDEETDPNLLWALRGGGGNFGIVTSFRYRVHPVTQVLGGNLIYDMAQAGDVLAFYRELTDSMSDELTSAPGFAAVPGGPVLAMQVCYTGDIAAGEAALARLRSFGSPLQDLIRPVPYLELQGQGPNPPPGTPSEMRAGFLPELNDDVIAALTEAMAEAPLGSIASMQHLHGATTRGDTALPLRDPGFDLFATSVWEEPGQAEVPVAWVHGLWDALAPHFRGVYLNGLDDEGPERVRAAYGDQFARLVELKGRYDPDNFFRVNHNIAPVG
jgi:FAD/FMN-containing dehydrogenase